MPHDVRYENTIPFLRNSDPKKTSSKGHLNPLPRAGMREGERKRGEWEGKKGGGAGGKGR
jgi:hypothetical protein